MANHIQLTGKDVDPYLEPLQKFLLSRGIIAPNLVNNSEVLGAIQAYALEHVRDERRKHEPTKEQWQAQKEFMEKHKGADRTIFSSITNECIGAFYYNPLSEHEHLRNLSKFFRAVQEANVDELSEFDRF